MASRKVSVLFFFFEKIFFSGKFIWFTVFAANSFLRLIRSRLCVWMFLRFFWVFFSSFFEVVGYQYFGFWSFCELLSYTVFYLWLMLKIGHLKNLNNTPDVYLPANINMHRKLVFLIFSYFFVFLSVFL